MDRKRIDPTTERPAAAGEPPPRGPGRWRFQLLAVALLIGLGVLGYRLLGSTRPPAEQRQVEAPVPVVQAFRVDTMPRTVRIQGQGTVRPLRETQVVPQVAGKVVFVSPSLVDGGSVSAGDTLVRLDAEDYELEVTLAEARVRDAEAAHALAIQESRAAVQEWRELFPETEPPDLVARRPQLGAAKARLDAERADLRKARLQLDRTRIAAPFDGVVTAKSVELGQFVSPGQVLAGVYGIAAAEIAIPLESRELSWFHVPGFTPGEGEGAAAAVRVDVAGRRMEWPGRVVRAQGEVDNRSRMINVVVRVEDPFSRKPPLAAGLFAQVEIEGRTLENAAFIPRSALRGDDRVWIVGDDDRIVFRTVEVARAAGDGVLVRSGLRDGDRVVTSPIRAVIEGMEVKPMLAKEP